MDKLIMWHVEKNLDIFMRSYKGGLKSSRPSLPQTRDKRPLGRESNRSWCHRHTTSMIKLFGHDSMDIGGSIRARWKVLGLAYNRCESRDKQLLAGPGQELVSPPHSCEAFLIATHKSLDWAAAPS